MKTSHSFSALRLAPFLSPWVFPIGSRAYYVPFSDVTHTNVMSAETELTQLRAGQVEVGPRFPDVILMQVIGAIADTMSAAAETINRHFSLGKDREIAERERAMLKAIQEYRATLAAFLQPVKPEPADSGLPQEM